MDMSYRKRQQPFPNNNTLCHFDRMTDRLLDGWTDGYADGRLTRMLPLTQKLKNIYTDIQSFEAILKGSKKLWNDSQARMASYFSDIFIPLSYS